MIERLIPIIVAARNRPHYLWACLDSLYRCTHARHHVTLVDMASDDPAVAKIIASFERRGFIDDVVRFSTNDPRLLSTYVFDRLDRLSPFFAYVEGDVVIAETGGCWLTTMAQCMDADSNLAMLGSIIDKRDFVPFNAAGRLRPDLDELALHSLIKGRSPERLQHVDPASEDVIFYPHNPAGRLMLLKTDALLKVGPGNDSEIDRRFREAGYTTGITTKVQHRHLSLLHIFDEPDYDYRARDHYMASVGNI